MADLGGSSGSSNQQSSNQVTIPYQLQGILGGTNQYGNNIAQDTRQTLGQLGNQASYINNMPTQGVAPLTDQQNYDISSIQGLASNPFGLLPTEQTAANAYTNLAQNPNQTLAAGEQAFANFTAPTVESQSALSGLGNSGALGENLAMAGEQAAVPLIQQGYQNQATGAAGLTSLGSQQYNQGTQNLQNALTAAGIPQQQAQQILNSVYQQQEQTNQAALGELGTIQSWLPALLGNTTTSNVNTSGINAGLSL